MTGGESQKLIHRWTKKKKNWGWGGYLFRYDDTWNNMLMAAAAVMYISVGGRMGSQY